jgi:hypothetical protein
MILGIEQVSCGIFGWDAFSARATEAFYIRFPHKGRYVESTDLLRWLCGYLRCIIHYRFNVFGVFPP